MSQVAQMAESLRGRGAESGFRMPPLSASRHLAGLLGALPVGALALSLPGRLAQLLSLTRGFGRLPQAPSRASGADLLSQLQSQVDVLRSQLLRAPAPPMPDLMRGAELTAAARVLGQLNINIFSPAGGAALAGYLSRLRAEGLLQSLAAPGLPASATQSLSRFGAAAEGFRLLGVDPRSPGISVPRARLDAIASEINAGPIALLATDRGRAALPSAFELDRMSAGLSAQRLERELAQLAPRFGAAPGGRLSDPLAALEASGCCKVLREVGELPAAAAGAQKAAATGGSLESIHQAFGVSAGAPDPARITAAMGQMRQLDADLPLATRELLRSPDLAGASLLMSLLQRAGAAR